MLDKSQEYLRLAMAIAALLIGLSVAYHYVIYIPEKDRQQQLEAQNKMHAALLQENTAKATADKTALERRTNYRICLSNAQESYSNRWDSSCKSLSLEADKNRADCVAKGYAEDYCRLTFPPKPAADCTLLGGTSDDYDAMLKEDKKRCLDEAKSGVLDTTPTL